MSTGRDMPEAKEDSAQTVEALEKNLEKARDKVRLQENAIRIGSFLPPHIANEILQDLKKDVSELEAQLDALQNKSTHRPK